MPPPRKPLSDAEVHDRLVAAERALGGDDAATKHGKVVLRQAKITLVKYQIVLLQAAERSEPDGP